MEYVIETFDLTKYYKKEIVGVEDLTFSVKSGEIFGFLGSNGAGKTTTIRILMNLIFPTSGGATIFGKDVIKDHLDICQNIGYIPSSVRPYRNLSGDDFLNYMAKLSGCEDNGYRKSLLEQFEFAKKDLRRKIKDYSSGMSRKLALIQTLQHRPRLLIMDEPTEGLDPVMQNTFYNLLNEYRGEGGTVFISSHHLLEVQQVCDRVGIIRHGKLVAVETIEDLLKNTTRTIYVKFKKDVDASQLASEAWQILKFEKNYLTAKLIGSIDDIIKLLGGFYIEDISLPELNLQDIFLGYYQEDLK